MQKEIVKLRNSKRMIKKVFNLIKKEVDLENDIIDSMTLEELTLLAKIDEELTNIIYLILDNKNS